MALFKSVLVLVVVIYGVCGAAPSVRVDAHNMYICVDYSACHEQLYQEYVEVKGKLLQIVERNVAFPNSIAPPNNKVITCVEIQDLDNNGKGGYYTIIGGGLEQTYATVNLKSQRSQGLRFIVKFFNDKPC